MVEWIYGNRMKCITLRIIGCGFRNYVESRTEMTGKSTTETQETIQEPVRLGLVTLHISAALGGLANLLCGQSMKVRIGSAAKSDRRIDMLAQRVESFVILNP